MLRDDDVILRFSVSELLISEAAGETASELLMTFTSARPSSQLTNPLTAAYSNAGTQRNNI